MRVRTCAATLMISVAITARASGAGAPVSLDAIEFPERTSVTVPFAATPAAPDRAFLEASVKVKEGQAAVELSFKRMAPALLFGGDVTSYVVWTVTRDGLAENVGELWVRDDSGSSTVASGQKMFAMMVTAETHPFVRKPSDLVIFASRKTDASRARNTPITFSAFAAGGRRATGTIAGMSYRDKQPVEVAQATKVLQIAEAMGGTEVAPQALAEARTNLAQAANTASVGSTKLMVDYARRALAKAGEAIRAVERREAERAVAEAEAKRQKEIAEAAAKALSAEENVRQAEEAQKEAEQARQKTTVALNVSEETRSQLAADTARMAEEASRLNRDKALLEANQKRLQAERDALAARLQGALAKVAEVRSSGRGLILSLSSGILFDVNRSALKPAARVTLAKLAGILLMLPDVNLRVEGYTDASGKPGVNQKLSKGRADAVAAFLAVQGVAEARMKSEGYGSENPVAPNETAAGKARNRRVEVVLAEGEIRPAMLAK